MVNKYPGTSITNEFSANGVKYRTEITKQNNKYLYTLKEGRKFIVKEGSKVNMQNQIAKILDKALKKTRVKKV